MAACMEAEVGGGMVRGVTRGLHDSNDLGVSFGVPSGVPATVDLDLEESKADLDLDLEESKAAVVVID